MILIEAFPWTHIFYHIFATLRSAAPLIGKISAPSCKGFSRNAASFHHFARERNSLNVSLCVVSRLLCVFRCIFRNFCIRVVIFDLAEPTRKNFQTTMSDFCRSNMLPLT